MTWSPQCSSTALANDLWCRVWWISWADSSHGPALAPFYWSIFAELSRLSCLFLFCHWQCAFSDYVLIDGTVPSSMLVLPRQLKPKCPCTARGHYGLIHRIHVSHDGSEEYFSQMSFFNAFKQPAQQDGKCSMKTAWSGILMRWICIVGSVNTSTCSLHLWWWTVGFLWEKGSLCLFRWSSVSLLLSYWSYFFTFHVI